MNVLVTGGAGYIGSHIAVELAEAGFDIIIADNYSNSSKEVVRRIEELAGRKIFACDVDVCDKAALSEVFGNHEIGAVIHCAGFKAVGESVREPLKYYRNNLGSTVALLEAMEAFSVNRIIFSSSATVYGVPKALPYTEDMETGPCTNPYGTTKLMSEQIIRDAAAARPEMSAVLLRYFNPVGAHPSGRIGENPSGIPNNLMPYIAQVAVGRLESLGVFGDDYPTKDGTGVRDYIHVVDLAKGHVAALQYSLEHTGVEVFNLGSGQGSSVLDLVRAFERANGVKIPYRILPRREGDLPAYWADASKAARVLGWKAEKTLEDMCRDTWNWQKNNPNGYEG
jgi:UDP-glucose 4-epimerase